MPIWNIIAGPILGLIGKLIPDKTAAAAAQAQLQMLAAQGALNEELAQLQAVTTAQSDINKVEAASTSLFVAGWRPYVGWICGTALGLDCIIRPLVNWIATLCGHPVDFPSLNNPWMQTTMSGMLGLGFGLRTYEKKQGIAGNH
jgi:Holin of 3TMs, for gene-transfer release